MILIYGGALEVLGQPKPMWLEWRDIEGLPIVGLSQSGHTLYVWIVRSGVPISYVIEINEEKSEVAGKIMDHWRRRQSTGENFSVGDNGDGLGIQVRPPDPEPPKD